MLASALHKTDHKSDIYEYKLYDGLYPSERRDFLLPKKATDKASYAQDNLFKNGQQDIVDRVFTQKQAIYEKLVPQTYNHKHK